MKVYSAKLPARHGFFTRQGGVSEGLFASLNDGLGSADDQDHVVENRARAANALGGGPLTTCYQIHSATAIVRKARTPLRSGGR